MSQTATLQKDPILEKAYEQYRSASLPDFESESWRKIRLGGFRIDEYPADGSVLETLTEGPVEVLDVNEVLSKDGELAEKIRSRIEERLKEADIFSLLSISSALSAKAVVVKGNLDQPVTIRHIAKSGRRFPVLTFLFFETSSSGCVIEEFRSETGEDALFTGLTDIYCAPNSQANYVSFRRPQDTDLHFLRTEADIQKDARLLTSVIHAGGQNGKSFVRARAMEPNAEFRGIGFHTGWAAQFHDMEMEAIHPADHTNSSLLYKTVMQGRSHSVFNGNLVIPAGVKHVDSYQSNHNILLSKKARAESMPRLVIFSEDVACEHGATVGELDEQALFFLMSRGLPEQEARKMLIEGFMGEIFSETPIGQEKTEDYWNEIHPLLNL